MWPFKRKTPANSTPRLVDVLPSHLSRYPSISMRLCSLVLSKRKAAGLDDAIDVMIAYYILFAHILGDKMGLAKSDVEQIVDLHARLTAQKVGEPTENLLFMARWFSDEFSRIAQEKDELNLSFSHKCACTIEMMHAEVIGKDDDEAYTDLALETSLRAVDAAIMALPLMD